MTHLPITIPSDFDVLVAKDEEVKAGQILARKRKVPSDVVIEVAKRLKLSPKKVAGILLKAPGDYLQKGEPLAKKEGFFTDTILISEISGTFSKYDRNTGSVTVRLTEEEAVETGVEEIVCPLDGKVMMCHNDQIILETEKNVLLGKQGVGGTFQGLLKIIDKDPKDEVMAEELGGEEIGSVVFAPGFSREAYAKAAAIGVGGLLTLNTTDADIAYLEEKRLVLPLIQVGSDVGLKIAKWQNKEIFVDGHNKAILLLSYEKSTR